MKYNFTIRTTKPEKDNKNYQRAKGSLKGWNYCVEGKPKDANLDVLSNCVGYACGRFNEIYNEIHHTTGHKYPYLNCDAENFITRAKGYYKDLVIDNKPEPGAIMVWNGAGSLAGHVAIVEDINEDGSILKSDSSWNGAAFRSGTITNSNGRWGMNSNYTFLGFIHCPGVKCLLPEPVERDETKEQVEVISSTLRVRQAGSLKATIYGYAKKGYYDILSSTEADGYKWVQIGEEQWIAIVEGSSLEWLPETLNDDLRQETIEEEISIMEEKNIKIEAAEGKEEKIEEISWKASITNLLKVKSLMTLILTGVAAYLTIQGKYNGFEDIYLMIVAFYFGTQVSKSKN